MSLANGLSMLFILSKNQLLALLIFAMVSYDPLYFCVVCCDLSIFISDFIDWIFSLCFLMSLANGLSILFILSKNQLLALLIFAMVSFVSFAFISALVFNIHRVRKTIYKTLQVSKGLDYVMCSLVWGLNPNFVFWL